MNYSYVGEYPVMACQKRVVLLTRLLAGMQNTDIMTDLCVAPDDFVCHLEKALSALAPALLNWTETLDPCTVLSEFSLTTSGQVHG